MQLIILSLLSLLVATYFGYKSPLKNKAAFFGSFLFMASMLLYGFYYVANYFTGSGIDESVSFHLSAGLDGAGAAEYQSLIFSTIAYVLIVIILSYYVFKALKKQAKNPNGHFMRYTTTVFLLVASFITNPAAHDIYYVTSSVFLEEAYSSEESFPEDFISISPSIEEKKNIVYIYLESVEATYLDEDLFPNLMPNIRKLQQSATTYTNIQNVTHAGWTIAGMTASQCGFPLFSPSHGNSLSGMDQFLPEANCIGDVLKNNGYYLSYMGGADLSFAGKGKFYKSHSFDSVQGKNELSTHLSDRKYMSGWGLYDDSLFAMLKEEYSQLSKDETPFGLFTLTLDTHHPKGHMPKSCKNLEYKDGSNPILNSVHCADALVKDFVDYIEKNPSQNGTVIVIASDHYAMKNTAWDDLNKGERRNLFMVIDSASKEEGVNVNKPGSILDVTPTLLSFLDTPVDGLGFGRNLNSDSLSLIEQKSDINSYLTEHQGVVKYLWSYPELDEGIKYSLEEEGFLLLGDRSISIPSIIKLDGDAKVDEIVFANSGRKKLSDYIEEMSIGQDFVWVDDCKIINAFAYPGEAGSKTTELCIASGTTGASEISAWGLVDGTSVNHSEIKDSLTSKNLSEKLHEERVGNVSNIIKYGAANLETFSVSSRSDMAGSVVVRSAGYGTGASFIEQNGSRIRFERGLTLVGLSNTHAPIKLSYIDSYGGSVTDQDALDFSGDFHSMMEDHSESFDTFLIIGHDSVVGSDTEHLNSSFSGTKLEKWSDIKHRQPYLAVLSSHGETIELLGDSEDSLTIRIKDFAKSFTSVDQRNLDSIERVAHAGGGYEGKTYTNSLEALEYNKNNYSFFEVDFSWTSDAELVCIHDWDNSFERSFGFSTESAVTLNEFKTLVADKSDVEKCTLSSLAYWVEKNPGKKIVTDVKARNANALKLIAERYPDLKDSFVPQVYQPTEYYIARLLGFDNVIWTLYRFRGDNEAVISHLENMDLYGLTMPRGKVDAGLAKMAFDERGVRSYVHTINSEDEYQKYLDQGASEIYTDWLY
ncbi:sulfatase-like hydrolase/transferase [Halomonas rhizosphaerae]|uniref:Sulfatase-like hydrolase/transferase n=1 Tax=Halomonas rhizosphaerae TaxID=3043296 RepID=A0ABT6V7A3_9GAMM|nr:sulfatase-like hydrolase/transferase [Halomonas rhizosphaerae]MDI5893074.1 sulfatase-like hydrolase/transferase [Halomonas rhizosphaerae]